MEVRGPEGWDFWPEIGKGGESGVTEDLGEFHSNWGRIHDSGHDAGCVRYITNGAVLEFWRCS